MGYGGQVGVNRPSDTTEVAGPLLPLLTSVQKIFVSFAIFCKELLG